jgi:hypothetical protein
MRLYQSQHQFYCGIDLHANAMYACVAGADGKKCLHQNFQVRNTESSLEQIQPYRNNLFVSGNWFLCLGMLFT